MKEKKINNKVESLKKKKKLFTAISTIMLSTLLLASVTYAWFTLTNKPKIEGFTINVGTTGKLEISLDNTTYDKSIKFTGLDNVCLRPLTSLDGKTFKKPKYSTEGKVTSVESITDINQIINKSDNDGGFLIKKDFYLKATTKNTKDIGIKLMAGSKNGDKVTGTYIYNNVADKSGVEAVRVSMTAGTTTKILEPSADKGATNAINDQYKESGWSESNPATIKQSGDGKFSENGSYTGDKSEELFKITPNQGTKVEMYIWIEGADKDSVNDIQGNAINYNFQFTSDDLE